jgi:hypothetical protein
MVTHCERQETMTQVNSLPTTPSALQDLYGDQLSIAVAQAAATMDRPEYNGRLQKAMDFVLTGAVTLNNDGTATVKSGSHTYQIHGECSWGMFGIRVKTGHSGVRQL